MPLNQDIIGLSADILHQKILKGEITASLVLEMYMEKIKIEEPRISSFITVLQDAAFKQAQDLDRKIAEKKRVGKLAGIPIAIKDNICTSGVRTTCASKMLENFIPPYDAYVIKRLKEEDAIIVGKTNLDEFAMGSSTENSAFFTTKNPYDTERIPGGSSGGSAAAVAGGEVLMALGSDTGGSIRQPASMTGIVGFKPTYGLVSRYGLIAFASSLDQIGTMTRNVKDTALLMDTISGKDPMDSTSVEKKGEFLPNLDVDTGQLRIGLPKEYLSEGIDPEVEKSIKNAVSHFLKIGAEVKEVSLPMSRYGIAGYYIVACAEASSNLARYDGVHYGLRIPAEDIISMVTRTRTVGFGKEVQRRIMLGTYALSSGYYSAYYLRALKVRRLIKEDYDNVFKEVDVIIGPTSPFPAFKLGEKLEDPLQMYLCDIFTVNANLAGIPAISIPCGFTRAGLPIGLQIQGKAFDDLKVLQIANKFEKTLGIVKWV